MADGQPDSTAVRTALWRALHTEVDGEPPGPETCLKFAYPPGRGTW
jgi:hypothetical protein